MKNLIISLSFLAISYTLGAQSLCEDQSYQRILSDNALSCEEIIIESALSQGCSKQYVDQLTGSISAQQMITFEHGATSFCKLRASEGYYTVVTDDMFTPPQAVLLFSRDD